MKISPQFKNAAMRNIVKSLIERQKYNLDLFRLYGISLKDINAGQRNYYLTKELYKIFGIKPEHEKKRKAA